MEPLAKVVFFTILEKNRKEASPTLYPLFLPLYIKSYFFMCLSLTYISSSSII